MRTKEVRNHVLETLALPKDYFGGDAKEILLSIISNYQIPLAVSAKSTPVKETSMRSTPVKAAPVARTTPVKAAVVAKTTPKKETPVKAPAEKLTTPQKSPHKSYDGSSEEDEEKGSLTPLKASAVAAPAAKRAVPKKKLSTKRSFGSSDEDSSSSSEDEQKAPSRATKVAKTATSSTPTKQTRAATARSKSPKRATPSNESIHSNATTTTTHTPRAYTPRSENERNDSAVKKGRFTKFESAVIQEAAERYAAESGIDPTELCTQYRKEAGGERNKHLPFWREVAELLPHRTKEVSRKSSVVIFVGVVYIRMDYSFPLHLCLFNKHFLPPHTLHPTPYTTHIHTTHIHTTHIHTTHYTLHTPHPHPHVTSQAIWHHTQRLLGRTKTGDGKFTAAEKVLLQQMVSSV